MAGSVMLINPRRRRRRARRARARAPRRRVRRRRRALAAYHNPRRHRRVRARRARRHGRRRVHRNPRLPFGIDLQAIGFGTAGLIGTHVLGKQLAAAMGGKAGTLDQNIVRIGSKAVVGVGLPLLAKRFIGSKTAHALAIGGGIAVLADILSTYAPKEWGLPSLADYQTGVLSDYQQGQLQGYGDVGVSEALSGSSIYDRGVYN